MHRLEITARPFAFEARLESEQAPVTGALAGNHLAAIVSGSERLAEFDEHVL